MNKSIVIDKNKIYNCDCKKIIKEMINANFKVDLILTDPPYNISRENNFNTIGRKGIDFGEWDKNFNQTSWLNGIGKIVNKNGSIIIFNDWKNMGEIAVKLEQEGFEVKDLIRWVKPSPMPRNIERRYVTDFEFLIWATKKGAKWTFNNNSETYLKPEWICSAPQKRIHPTEKPEPLIENLLLVHSNVGDIVFDPFSGSGCISSVAEKLDRYYIACEISQSFFNMSKKRIQENFLKPPFNHLGNKRRIIAELIGNFPKKEIKYFIEPFAGSSIVTSCYRTPKYFYLNDKDKHLSELLNFLSANDSDIIISKIEHIIKEYKLPIEQKIKYQEQYNKLKTDYNKEKCTDNYKLLVLILFGFNQQIRFNSKLNFNIPAGKFFWSSYHKQKLKNYIDNSKNKKIKFYSLDFDAFVDKIIKTINHNESLFYLDPPYLLSNATYNFIWTEKDEQKLINKLQQLTDNGFKWCLSNLIESKGKINQFLVDFIEKNKQKIKWKFLSDVDYHNSSYQRNSRDKKDIEILVWGNYE